jgi:hypothetical protein
MNSWSLSVSQLKQALYVWLFYSYIWCGNNDSGLLAGACGSVHMERREQRTPKATIFYWGDKFNASHLYGGGLPEYNE